MKKVVIILPCYFEESILEHSFSILNEFFTSLIHNSKIHPDSCICMVDDGSKDNTWSIINKLHLENKHVIAIKLSRNFGHQYALLAALDSLQNQFDSYITIDADLQDDFTVVSEMVEKQINGASIVYGVRKNRNVDSFFKRKTAELFYTLMKHFGVRTIFNHADFRLIDNLVLINFLKYKEVHLFLRSVFPLIGFKSEIVYYNRKERIAGESKYPMRKMISFAWEGITSFSITPLRFTLNFGVFTFFLSIAMACWVIYVKISGNDVQGWTSLSLLILFFSSLQMIFLGIIGEYLGKIYQEVKQRPRFIVEEIKNSKLS